MSILTWIDDNERLKLLNASKYIRPSMDSNKGLWTRCDKCGVILYIKHLIENQRVCFGCAYHLQMNSPERIKNLLDKDSWRPFDETVSPCDPLEFYDQKNYTDRLQAAQDKTGLQDAIQTGSGRIEGIPVALGVMDFDFMGGSMGSVVGEKITRLIEYATQEGLTLILICASGGARMQEGVFGLMQMAKISSALRIYQSCANLLYISILTSPTTGGVTASFGMLGDIIFAEPRALIAFAGRRVIEQTLCEDLPEDFQSSEYMLNHGLVDLIVPRRFLRQALSESIKFYKNAPFKKIGQIPFGVQNPIHFVTEEKVRRQWKHQAKPSDSQSTDNLTVTLPQKLESDQVTPRNQSNYRDILTSFQMIFHLFSKQLALPEPSHSTGINTYTNDFVQEKPFFENRVLQEEQNGNKDASSLTKSEFLFPLLKQSSALFKNNENDRSTFSEKDDSLDSTTAESNSSSIQKATPGTRTELFHQNNSKMEVSLSLDPEEEIDFFNQAIELAATESIEWRAFYVSQRISKTAAEDFFQSEVVRNSSEDAQTSLRENDTTRNNTLFYKSICRSTLR